MRVRVGSFGMLPLVLLLTLGVVACGGSAPPPPEAAPGSAAPDTSTPEGTVQLFFEHLKQGRNEDALALYTAEARQALEDPETFDAWVSQITREGTISSVRVEDAAAVQPGSTTVDFHIVYQDGTEARRSVQLEGGDGQWRMGLIL